MQLRQIFSKDIDRNINPAVVVSEQDKSTMEIEIEEYVFTEDLIDNLYKFLFEVFNQKNGKTAIWINGYYGSGKSHFIKYIHYCLNKDSSELAFEHFIENAKEVAGAFSEATPSNILQLKNKAQSNDICTIMFNIDAVAGMQDRRDKLPKIILNQFNEFRGYNGKNLALAKLVEKHLDKIGKFDEFKKKINEDGNYNWDKDAATLASLKLNDILNVVESLDSSIDRDSLRQKIQNPDDITIEGDLIPEFIEYLDNKSDKFRLIFLVDEVSQYIGSNTNLLLNLQTIIEEVGANCNNKVWFATTAQQSLDQVIDNTEISGEDFGKILGRFETRISLQSQDAAFITKKRILDKNSDGVSKIKTFYDKNKDAIENQFYFSHDLYKGYDDFEVFNLSYPFIPYQFRLISDVFESFSNLEYVIKEVKDNERSILGITHFTVKEYADKEVGYIVPFDGFFNAQFKQNLTHTARRIIDRAMNLDDVKNDPFAQRVVNTLFMISNLIDSKQITFPANLDNLSILLIENPDTNKLELQRKIQTVIEKLKDLNIIREENGQYQFFKEDEIEVANLIQNQTITQEDRLKELYDSIFSSFIPISKKFPYGNSNFNLSISFDGKEIFTNGDIPMSFSFYTQESPHQRAIAASRRDMIFCLDVPVNENKDLLTEFNMYVKTRKYIRQNSDTASGNRRKTLDDFATRNKTKLNELKKKFENAFKNAPIISAQQVLDPSELKSTDPKTRYLDALSKHFESIYKKHKLAEPYASNNDALKQSANDRQLLTDKELTTAEEEINNWLDRTGDSASLDEVIKEFAKQPFGWRDLSVMDILIRLAKKEKRQFEWRNEKIDLPAFYLHGIKASERAAIAIKSIEMLDRDTIVAVVKNYRYIFNESLNSADEANSVFDEIIKKIKFTLDDYKPIANNYASEAFGAHLRSFVTSLEELAIIREPKRLFEKIEDIKDEIKSQTDSAKELKEFIETQFSNYKTIRDFSRVNEQNFNNLDAANGQKANSLMAYFKSAELPSNDFPKIRKIHSELEIALKDLQKELHKQVINAYEKVYDEVDEHAKNSGVSEDKLTYAPRDEKLDRLKEERNLSSLQLALANISTFKADCLKAIGDAAGKKSVTFKISASGLPSQIENEEQLDNYLDKLKTKLSKELKEGNAIIIK